MERKREREATMNVLEGMIAMVRVNVPNFI